jgi:prepilin-type N-terminal cleavage/methylation domain-containing protein
MRLQPKAGLPLIPYSQCRGFTLLELLITVGIISILSAIAVPNFVDAQVRARSAREISDMRTLKTAIESYVTDNGCYPFAQSFSSPSPYQKLRQVTTPIAYIATVPRDPFDRKSDIFSQFILNEPTDTYLYNTGAADVGFGGAQTSQNRMCWSLTGRGPDGDFQFPYYAFSPRFVDAEKRYLNWIYDPTNGTLSTGDTFLRGGAGQTLVPEIQ